MVVSANATAPIITSNNTDNFFIILFDPFSLVSFLKHEHLSGVRVMLYHFSDKSKSFFRIILKNNNKSKMYFSYMHFEQKHVFTFAIPSFMLNKFLFVQY